MEDDVGVTFALYRRGREGESEGTIWIAGHVSPERNRRILGSGTEENGQGLLNVRLEYDFGREYQGFRNRDK
ncbi:hypothetical protein K0M31_002421 [Melipona bicolor]|uniref:Uncharacterized protein n=1 Tax=Melipona bicolor TaxID=60889 RepID=A0AA40KYI3_9HYME|nr:hypothetical protein K0M31_002421 [Melipona bicolor]